MKKLLSILTISTLTASVPAPLLANTIQNRVKRDIGGNTKDVTTGFDIKIKNDWNKIYVNDKPFNTVDNKYYVAIWGRNKWNINKFKYNDWLVNISENLKVQFKTLRYFESDEWSTTEYEWEKFPQYFKGVYRWDGVGEPQTPKIDNNGNITNWIVDKTPFQQGILFSLVDGSKTATWSNNGMRLTVDGETNININNPNVTEVYWDGSLQPQSSKQWKINVKPETTAKDHKLVIKYDINGTKYTSEDIMVSMLAKIDSTPTPVQQNLSDLIKNTDLGNIIDNNDDTIFLAVNKANSEIIDDFSQIEITKKVNHSATLSAKPDSKSYKGSVDIKYNVVPATVVDLKIELKPTVSSAIVNKDYLAQLDSSKMTNKVDTFYYANSESVITMVKPTDSSVITGVVYGCDDKWNKTSQSSNIDPAKGIKLDGSQLGAVQGRYLIDLKNELGQTNTIYLQIHSEKDEKAKAYWNTDNGKQFEQWAQDQEQGYENIRGSSASQLNNLFELSKTWKQSLKHLDLKLDNFVVDNIKNVSQDEIDNYKTKLLASVKAQVEKYAPNVVEKTDYVISVDNLVAGDWTTSKDVKVQAVDGSTKLLSFTVKTIPVQQKEEVTALASTPVSSDKGGKSIWKILGIVAGSLAGLGLAYWLFKRFVFNKYFLPKIKRRRHLKLVEQVRKEEAEKDAQNNKGGEE
ncbi:hypothetical protein SRED_003081 (plasmid) [Spiroplasma melliferum]|uniref:Adhesion related protein, transmembrane n=1 Tax=Spiroplasma melliferum TaxID=2134 RepID=A0ABX5UBV2_SPIME|nr:DUF3688 family protein [Spiroplasma melliferum]QCO23198.1 hypothetical protein SRED_003060 [Spiroplasma melliferum]QCO23219.1 hypothetical protein SRED_003081 [Spiroplasma melliferum]